MDQDDATKIQSRRQRRVAWDNYSYWELFIRPELQKEFDEMLASRPRWPSQIFIAVTLLLLAGVLLSAVLFG